MKTPPSDCRPFVVLAVLGVAILTSAPGARAAQPARGAVTIPICVPHPKRQVFTSHPGWIDAYSAGKADGLSTRLGDDGRFSLKGTEGTKSVIVTFDRAELPPIILPRWKPTPGASDANNLPINAEYCVVPPGYPKQWRERLAVTSRDFWQTFMPRSKHLYACMLFDGPRVVSWGNKANVTIHRDRINGLPVEFAFPGGGSFLSAAHTDFEFPNVGWRHGDMTLTPGKRYVVRVGGYKSHGGKFYPLQTFYRPKDGASYPRGEAHKGYSSAGSAAYPVSKTRYAGSVEHKPLKGDLCMVMIGDANGQIIENQVRSAEWNILIPRRKPTKSWGQTFRANGKSLAGLVFWGSNGGAKPVTCRVVIRRGGPEGKVIGTSRVARAHDSLLYPVIRYRDTPGTLPGYERYYPDAPVDTPPKGKPGATRPADLFQVAFAPDEVPLKPGETYYVELTASEPIVMFADGDFYRHGFAYYNGEQVRRATGLQHGDARWTLVMTIVTYKD